MDGYSEFAPLVIVNDRSNALVNHETKKCCVRQKSFSLGTFPTGHVDFYSNAKVSI